MGRSEAVARLVARLVAEGWKVDGRQFESCLARRGTARPPPRSPRDSPSALHRAQPKWGHCALVAGAGRAA